MSSLIKELIFSSIITSVIFLGDSFGKKKQSYYIYVLIFFLFFLGSLFFDFFLNAEEDHCNHQFFIAKNQSSSYVESFLLDEIYPQNYLNRLCTKKLTQEQINKYTNLRNYHRIKADELWFEAKIKWDNLDDCSTLFSAKTCFKIIIAACLPNTPFSKLLAMLIVVIDECGVAVIEEVRTIYNIILESKYEYEMCEFYQDIICRSHEF